MNFKCLRSIPVCWKIRRWGSVYVALGVIYFIVKPKMWKKSHREKKMPEINYLRTSIFKGYKKKKKQRPLAKNGWSCRRKKKSVCALPDLMNLHLPRCFYWTLVDHLSVSNSSLSSISGVFKLNYKSVCLSLNYW